MTFAQSIRYCLRNYATFSGRATRSEYWWFVLFVSLVSMVLAGIGLGLAFGSAEIAEDPSQLFSGAPMIFLGLSGIFVLAMLLPMWAVGVRRFHDRNLSGWVYLGLALLGMVPWIGFLATIASLVITVLRGTPGPNKFGPDPMAGFNAEVFA